MNAALVYLYARTIRDGLGGLEHVEALLRLRGIDPNTLRVSSQLVSTMSGAPCRPRENGSRHP